MTTPNFLNKLLNRPAIKQPIVSPDGRWVAWTWDGLGSVGDVYATKTDGTDQPIKLTSVGQTTWVTSWLPDSSGVIVEHDNDGDERNQLDKVLIKEPLVLHTLISKPDDYFVRGGQITKDEMWLVYAANYDFEANKPMEASWVYRYNLATREIQAIAKPQKSAYFFPELNSTSTHVLYTRSDVSASGQQLWLASLYGSSDEEIINVGDDAKVFGSWLLDGQGIVVVAEVDDHKKVGIWSLATRNVDWIIDDPSRNIEDAYMPPGATTIVIEEIIEAVSVTTLYDLNTRSEKPVKSAAPNMFLLAQLPQENNWIALVYGSKQLKDIVVIDANNDSKVLRSITKIEEVSDLHSSELFQAKPYSWDAADGLKISGWLYRPTGSSVGTIVYVHGGPTDHSQDLLDPEIQYYVSQGFTVLDPNYRGSTGYGLAFENAIKDEGWGSKEQDDIIAGIKALIHDGIAEEYKVGITGTSYGGYSSWHALVHSPSKYIAAAVPVSGMTDLVVDYNTTRPDLRPYSVEMMGGTPDELPEKYYERSPINYIENITAKLLIVQGKNDPNVTMDNVIEVEKKLIANNIAYETLLFDDEGHGINKSENLKMLYPQVAKFFKESFSVK